jgi:hypothetical protein
MTPQGPEKQVQTLPAGTFDRKDHFQGLPPDMLEGDVIMSRHDWSWSAGLQTCLKVGLEQLFFHLEMAAEPLELTRFLRTLLQASEDDLNRQDGDRFGGRVTSFAMEVDTPSVEDGRQALTHVLQVNSGLDDRAFAVETRNIHSFWARGPHLLRARLRRPDINIQGKRTPVMYISQESLGQLATLVRIHLDAADLTALPEGFLLKDEIDTRNGHRATRRKGCVALTWLTTGGGQRWSEPQATPATTVNHVWNARF